VEILAEVQPVNAGITGSGATVVVVVVGGTGPVNETTNVSYNGWFAEPLSWKPVATQKDTETHDTEFRALSLVLGLGLVTVDQTLPFHCSTNVRYAEPLYW
jgi:glucose-6-phosphate dehydrogenase assembly protein OpcA